MPAVTHRSMSEGVDMIWLHALLVVLAPFLLALGLTMPLVRFETLYVFSDTPSLIDIVGSLWLEGDVALSIVVALLSIVFPAVKLVGITVEMLAPGAGEGGLAARLMPHLSRWAMMDVLLVAIVVFAAKTSGLASAFTQPGLWFYAGSSVAASILQAIAAKRRRPAGG